MKFDGLRNLAVNKTAQQSSISKWSQPDDASRALADDGKRYFAFHTNIEDNPWWQVDLGAVYPLYYVVVGNRRNVCQENAITLTIETSLDGQTWQLIHTGLISWDDDLVWPLGGLASACFVRLSLKERTYLHLAKVEIWGLQEAEAKPALYENNLLWVETKPEGLQELQAFLTAPSEPQEITLDLGDFHPIWALEFITPADMGFESIKDLKIETSADGHKWWLIHEGLLFWNGRLYYPLQGEIMARFIKISRSAVDKRFRWPLVKVFTRRQPELQVRVLRNDGSGSRLVSLLNAIYMAKLLGCDYKFFWQGHWFMQGDVKCAVFIGDAREVFRKDFIEGHLLDNERPNNASKLHVARELCRRQLTRADMQEKPGIIHSTYRSPVGLYHARLEPPHSCFRSFFENLSFSSIFQEAIEMAKRVDLPPNYVAIHLRSGDIVFGDTRQEILCWQTKTAPLQLAKMALEKLHHENRPIVLFGQDADELNYFASLYKVSLAVDYLPLETVTSAQRDLFELVLMSRASRIYAGPSSLFARCAALIGGNVNQINLHAIASSEEKSAYMKADLEQNAACYHPLHNSFSYLYLYHLNHLTANREESAFYLDQAKAYDSENEVIHILRAVECFKHHNEKAGEDLLAAWLKLAFDQHQQTIQYEPNRFLHSKRARHILPVHMKNYFQPLEAAAKQGYPNAAAFMSIMYNLLNNKEQALFWQGMALGFLVTRS